MRGMEPDAHDDHSDHDSRSPALAECPTPPPTSDLEDVSRRRDASRRKHRTILCALVLALLSNFCYYASELPLLRLVEYKLCDTYYERSCKIPQIQNKVALVIGCKTAFDAIPPLLTSMWYASLANKIGRRPVIALACSGELLNLLCVMLVGFTGIVKHIEWIWLASLMLMIGGGQFLLYAMFVILLIDSTAEAKRLQWFSILHSITLLNVLFAAPLTAILMQQSLWLAFLAIICTAVLRYPVIWAIPGIAHLPVPIFQKIIPPTLAEPGPTQPLLNRRACEPTEPPSSVAKLRALLAHNGVLFCFTCFLVKRIAFTSEFLMFQYASELLDQSLDDTAWIRIPLGFSASIITILCLPIFFRASEGRREKENDLASEMQAVRTSLFVLTAGFGLYWIAPTPALMTAALLLCGAGEGLAPSLQAVVSAVVTPDLHTDLFATISIIDTTAKLFGGPIMAATFSIRDQDGRTYGYCFMLSMILFSLLWCASWAPSPRRIQIER